jgi:Cu/Ag efflux pump CusA
VSGTATLGSLAGLLTVLGIAVRHTVLLVQRYRDLRHEHGHAFGPEVVRQGTGERAPAILMTTVVAGLAVLPFALFAGRPGLEVIGPMAKVILGGLVTATLYTLFVVPALYARLGAAAMPEASYEDDVPATQRVAV